MKKNLIVNIGVAFLCLILGFISSSYHPDNTASNINVSLVGETSYALGDIAEFEAVVKDAPKNLNKVVAWKVLNNNKVVNFKLLKDNNIIFPVGITPTKMTVLMHLAYIDPTTKQLTGSDFFTQEVVVGGDTPVPPIPPTPPAPTPEPKDGKYEIAVMVYKNAKTLVKGGNIPVAAKALSASYVLTAGQINKGNYTTLKEVYEGLKSNNNDAFNKAGENKDNWQEWDAAIQKRIAFLHNNKQLPQLSDHADLFREIADGLSYVK